MLAKFLAMVELLATDLLAESLRQRMRLAFAQEMRRACWLLAKLCELRLRAAGTWQYEFSACRSRSSRTTSFGFCLRLVDLHLIPVNIILHRVRPVHQPVAEGGDVVLILHLEFLHPCHLRILKRMCQIQGEQYLLVIGLELSFLRLEIGEVGPQQALSLLDELSPQSLENCRYRVAKLNRHPAILILYLMVQWLFALEQIDQQVKIILLYGIVQGRERELSSSLVEVK